ncbi:MAG: orotidine-5'-phosphate decarboxylase [Deltaproteobacteria bacterium]|nr:orotidine-5'-phosphate decarboxylase [Deltaproteobacteria bacterium]
MKPTERIIFPLDVSSKEEALKFTTLLKDSVGVFKIGLELFVKEGPSVVEAVRKAAPNAKIFLDMKFHDIPETVRRAMRSAASLGVDFITVHTDEGGELLKAAVEEAGTVKVLGVTVLTSQSAESLKSIGFIDELTDPSKLVLHRARLAKNSGCAGIVCSGLEVKNVKDSLGDELLAITPGIRLKDLDVKSDDQKRIVSPFEAVRDGADYIVVGRPIRNAADPKVAAKIVAEDIEKAL